MLRFSRKRLECPVCGAQWLSIELDIVWIYCLFCLTIVSFILFGSVKGSGQSKGHPAK